MILQELVMYVVEPGSRRLHRCRKCPRTRVKCIIDTTEWELNLSCIQNSVTDCKTLHCECQNSHILESLPGKLLDHLLFSHKTFGGECAKPFDELLGSETRKLRFLLCSCDLSSTRLSVCKQFLPKICRGFVLKNQGIWKHTLSHTILKCLSFFGSLKTTSVTAQCHPSMDDHYTGHDVVGTLTNESARNCGGSMLSCTGTIRGAGLERFWAPVGGGDGLQLPVTC